MSPVQHLLLTRQQHETIKLSICKVHRKQQKKSGGFVLGKLLLVTSGKGGVGKTTVTANIGLGLARLNKKVVVVDTDIGLRNLDVVLGLETALSTTSLMSLKLQR